MCSHAALIIILLAPLMSTVEKKTFALYSHHNADATCMRQIRACVTYVHILALTPSVTPGAYEPPEGRKERPTPHYSVKRHLNLNSCDAFLIWTSTQVVQKCCFHNQCTTLQVRLVHLQLRALVMKTTLLDHSS